MTGYNSVFGATNTLPAQVSEISLNLTQSVTLVWPTETAPNANLAAQIVDINSNGAYLITLPPANQVSPGQALVMNNLSAFLITVTDASGAAIVSLVPGTIWFVYVRDNGTPAGVWGQFQYGAQTSQPNAAALAGPGIQAIGTKLGQFIPITPLSSNFTAGPNDQAALFNWEGATGVLGLPFSAVGDGYYIQVRNSGSSTLTVQPSGSEQINDNPQLVMSPGDSCIVCSDGAQWFTIGLGTASTGFFNVLVISLSGLSGEYALPTAAYNQIGYKLTGALAGNMIFVVPPFPQEYWINNQTSGGTLSISLEGQASPPALGSGLTGIFYSDGTNVLNAISNALQVPVPVSQGGTAGTTASAARVNLVVLSAADAILSAQLF